MIDAIKKANITSNYVEIEVVCDDIIKVHQQNPGARIVTASNPSFSPDGGLDAVLSKHYSWDNPKEFEFTEDLFFVRSVNLERKATEEIILRALAGVFFYRHRGDFILPVLGGGIGGLEITKLIALLQRVFRFADLTSANLRSANLSFANLSSANLRSADLTSANLRSANLRSANLRSANLSFANLSSANLRSADLTSADLRSANLTSADLYFANLTSANLSSADLYSANLSSADPSSANLTSAQNLAQARHNETTAFFALTCPSEGAFIGWKKANGCIVKLQITERAKRSSATTRKCRCSEAKVLAIYDGKKKIKSVASSYISEVIYEVGKLVKPKRAFDENRWNECSSGIHFFITREEAEQWTE